MIRSGHIFGKGKKEPLFGTARIAENYPLRFFHRSYLERIKGFIKKPTCSLDDERMIEPGDYRTKCKLARANLAVGANQKIIRHRGARRTCNIYRFRESPDTVAIVFFNRENLVVRKPPVAIQINI